MMRELSSPHNNNNKAKGRRKQATDSIKIAIINCRSIKNMPPELGAFVTTTDPDVILGTESWLTPDIGNS